MKKAILLCICQLLVISCTQSSYEENLIKDSLNRTIDLGMFEMVLKSDTIVSLESIRNKYSYMYLVYLQDGCKPCYHEYVFWQNEMKGLNVTDAFTVLFIINGESYEKFMSELIIYEPEYDLSSESFYIVMDPDQNYIRTNLEIDHHIIERSIMIDNKNKIKLIGQPFASEQMTVLFKKIIRK